MSEGDGQRIGRIRGWGFREAEQDADHEGDLVFIRSPLSDDCHFDFFRGVFVNGNPVIGGGDHGGGAGGSHGNRGAVGLDIDDPLNGDFIGLVFLDEMDEMCADRGESSGLGDVFRDVNHIITEHGWLSRIAFKNGIARVTDGWVNGEDAHAVS